MSHVPQNRAHWVCRVIHVLRVIHELFILWFTAFWANDRRLSKVVLLSVVTVCTCWETYADYAAGYLLSVVAK